MGACIEDPAGKRSERIAEIRCEKEDVERLFEVANRLSLDAAKAVVVAAFIPVFCQTAGLALL